MPKKKQAKNLMVTIEVDSHTNLEAAFKAILQQGEALEWARETVVTGATFNATARFDPPVKSK